MSVMPSNSFAFKINDTNDFKKMLHSRNVNTYSSKSSDIHDYTARLLWPAMWYPITQLLH